MFKEEVGSLQERNERLETDLRALQEKQTSQREEWSTEKAHWESKVSIYMYMLMYVLYVHVHVDVCILTHY